MAAANQGNPDTAASIYEFTAKDIKGNDVSLEKYRGHGEFESEFTERAKSKISRFFVEH